MLVSEHNCPHPTLHKKEVSSSTSYDSSFFPLICLFIFLKLTHSKGSWQTQEVKPQDGLTITLKSILLCQSLASILNQTVHCNFRSSGWIHYSSRTLPSEWVAWRQSISQFLHGVIVPEGHQTPKIHDISALWLAYATTTPTVPLNRWRLRTQVLSLAPGLYNSDYSNTCHVIL